MRFGPVTPFNRAVRGAEERRMGKPPKVIAVQLSRAEHYMVSRMLMAREPLTRKQWTGYDQVVEALCQRVLRQLPANYPESAIWDNRRRHA
jgi:hypothetical protein